MTYAILGITGQVGGVVARTLLASGHDVRGIVRDSVRAKPWLEAGCTLAVADLDDPQSLASALEGAEGVFVMLPPNFDPSPDFREALALIENLRQALLQAAPNKVVCLSTIGAQATQTSLLRQLGLMEQHLSTLPMPITFLRAAWFMENFIWDVPSARDEGVFRTFLQPQNKHFPMVAVADVGRAAAELLNEEWAGHRIVELEGPERYSPAQVSDAFANVIGREVTTTEVPSDSWESMFASQGMKNPIPRVQMLKGFIEGWIEFEGPSRLGSTQLSSVVLELVERG